MFVICRKGVCGCEARLESGMDFLIGYRAVRLRGRWASTGLPTGSRDDKLKVESLESETEHLRIGICGGTIMKKMKDILCSENGMKIVNALFLLSMIFYKSGLLFIAYIVWIAYLVFCVKHADSKGSKIAYSVFIGIAAIMICLNLYFLLRG